MIGTSIQRRLGRAGGSLLLAATGLTTFATACDDAAYCFDCTEAASSTVDASSSSSSGEGGTDQTISVGALTTVGGGGDDCDADTETDVDNCGACDNRCALPGAIPACEGGECVVSECLPGAFDVDPDVPGCEYTCDVPEVGPEVCDGLDNDCDGKVDTDDEDLTPPPGLCNTTPDTPCEATEVICIPGEGWVCDYPDTVEIEANGVIRDQEARCDGIDGDCDGAIDEFYADRLGDECGDLALGQCQDKGIVKCDPENDLATYCDLTELPDAAEPTDELCNGKDDDCDGFVDDELAPTAFAMVDIGGGVFIDAYEASRPDATALVAGTSEAVSCSSPDVLPWAGGGYLEATAACTARGAGFRLCTADELETACRGAEDQDYPYGDDFDDDACNGVENGEGRAVPTGSLASCATTAGIFDLSGNLAEWSTTQTNEPAATPSRIFQLHGGSYLAPELGLACTIDFTPRALEVTLLPSIGFRCCYEP